MHVRSTENASTSMHNVRTLYIHCVWLYRPGDQCIMVHVHVHVGCCIQSLVGLGFSYHVCFRRAAYTCMYVLLHREVHCSLPHTCTSFVQNKLTTRTCTELHVLYHTLHVADSQRTSDVNSTYNVHVYTLVRFIQRT